MWEIVCIINLKVDKMWGFKCILFCVLFYLVLVDVFYFCKNVIDDDVCLDNVVCEDCGRLFSYFECRCEEGFVEIDFFGLIRGGSVVIVCIGMG